MFKGLRNSLSAFTCKSQGAPPKSPSQQEERSRQVSQQLSEFKTDLESAGYRAPDYYDAKEGETTRLAISAIKRYMNTTAYDGVGRIETLGLEPLAEMYSELVAIGTIALEKGNGIKVHETRIVNLLDMNDVNALMQEIYDLNQIDYDPAREAYFYSNGTFMVKTK